MDKMREAFETWVTDWRGTKPRRSKSGTQYVNPEMQQRWVTWQSATASAEAKYGALIHWPDCWDTMAYPTLESALREIGCNPEDCTKLGGCDA